MKEDAEKEREKSGCVREGGEKEEVIKKMGLFVIFICEYLHIINLWLQVSFFPFFVYFSNPLPSFSLSPSFSFSLSPSFSLFPSFSLSPSFFFFLLAIFSIIKILITRSSFLFVLFLVFFVLTYSSTHPFFLPLTSFFPGMLFHRVYSQTCLQVKFVKFLGNKLGFKILLFVPRHAEKNHHNFIDYEGFFRFRRHRKNSTWTEGEKEIEINRESSFLEINIEKYIWFCSNVVVWCSLLFFSIRTSFLFPFLSIFHSLSIGFTLYFLCPHLYLFSSCFTINMKQKDTHWMPSVWLAKKILDHSISMWYKYRREKSYQSPKSKEWTWISTCVNSRGWMTTKLWQIKWNRERKKEK